MTDKTASRFFSVQLAIYGVILLAIAIIWPIAHIAKGTMNVPGGILSIGMFGVSIHLVRLAWIDLRKDFKKHQNPNSK